MFKNSAIDKNDRNPPPGKKGDPVDTPASCYNPQKNTKRRQFSKKNSTSKSNDEGPHPMGYKFLEDLVKKDSNEILFTLKPSKNFLCLLNSPQISKDKMALILIAIGKACESNQLKNLIHFLSTVCVDLFKFTTLHSYIAKLAYSECSEQHLKSISYLVSLLQKFQEVLPAASNKTLLIILPNLKSVLSKLYEKNFDLPFDLLDKIDALEKENEQFHNGHSEKESVKMSKEEKQQLQEPPNDFRYFSIMPTAEDLHKNLYPFLRPNIKCGKYMDAKHYLDVQFRLLREDFICPLREGVQAYVNKSNIASGPNIKGIRIYRNVSVGSVEPDALGMLNWVKFDTTNLSGVKWESSKRLLPGSLVCLSVDNFNTVLFGTVVRRDAKHLKDGLVLLKFENLEVAGSNVVSESFIMIETQAYFESYQHILNSLQEINEDELPFKDYIVDVKSSVKPPAYLKEYTMYDLRPVMTPLPSEPLYQKVFDDDEILRTNQSFPASVDHGKEFRVLNLNNWPDMKTWMDKSQEEAIKLSLTKEFAIIQGPPGTGKTYVGLRIVQTLLHNWQKWNYTNETSSILVICYTNHALDQFLEGILLFTSRIVRIGGRCNSERLEPYRLRSLQTKNNENKNLPRHIFHNLHDVKSRLRNTLEEIKQIQDIIKKAQNSILNCEFLIPVMSQRHSELLPEGLEYWLSPNYYFEEEYEQPTKEKVTMPDFLENLDGDTDSETDDVDYILAMREVDDNDSNIIDFTNPFERTQMKITERKSEWRTQGGQKKQKKYISEQLKLNTQMSTEEVEEIRNVWQLNHNDRWNLYRYWVHKLIDNYSSNITDLLKKFDGINKELKEVRNEIDLSIIRRAKIIGMTTTGASKYRNIVQNIQPKIVIVEEAAEVLEAHIVTSLSEKTQHLILIGDHQQLRPSPTVYQLCRNYNLDISLFERMLNNGMDCQALRVQHRMRPNIAELLVPHIYKNLENHSSVLLYENIKGVEKNIFFINHSEMERSVADSHSHKNLHEASFLVSLCKYFLLQGYQSSSITILTTYSGQFFLIKQLMKTKGIEGVRVAIVDNFQGEENDIILISFVRSNEEGAIGFLKISNRVCVSLSRAKKGLFCIGNFELLLEKSILWKNIISVLEKQEAIGPSLELVCQNHPKNCTLVANEKDFKNVPEGGCLEPCEYRLECGHACTRSCHVYDPEHLKFECKKKCQKIICNEGHLCTKKCFEICGKCTFMVKKIIPACRHLIGMPCYIQPDCFSCTMPCNKKLKCGHRCFNKCGNICTQTCVELVQKKSPCGHEVSLPCNQSASYEAMLSCCNQVCEMELSCGHICSGRCSTCFQGRLHVKCNNPCKKILICGHQCQVNCAAACPPCKRKCENRCVHSKCPLECGIPCNQCEEKCEWQCDHHSCANLCKDICNRPICNESCNKFLKCGHRCISICGEPCSSLCKICDEEEVTTIFFGNEDEEDAKFIELEDCHHVLELSGMIQYMNGKDEEIQMKCCPKCKTVIRKSNIFNDVTKKCLEDIEKVKKKFYGEKSNNQSKQRHLVETIEAAKNQSHLSRHYDFLQNFLKNKKIVGKSILNTIENTVNLLKEFEKVINNLSKVSYEITSGILPPICKKSINYFCIFSTVRHVMSFLSKKGIDASEQQQQDAFLLIKNLKLISQLLNLNKSYSKNSKWSKVANIYSYTLASLIKFAPLTEETLKKAEADIKEMKQILGEAVLNITDEERVEILKAMKLQQGHWFTCPNGHVYCITECGGAMVESKCNECDASIGGQNHHLRGDNRLASEMDNAQHAAWSETANLRNYNIW